MTGHQIAMSAVGIVTGAASWVTGTIVANVPAINEATPVTFALTAGGISLAAVGAWKVSRAWSHQENEVARLKERIAELEKKNDAK